ncbi:MAG TPA: hypothetical protein VK790_13275 [Solirubrobacteraceae bacterium]|jgi:hypothetical protein|nr:hypothetical protein [Solirubrobacteraceae bacterium]
MIVALTLTGCETSAEKSAKLEKVAKRQAAEAKRRLTQRSLSITHPSSKVRVVATTIVHSSEGTAAVVTLRNLSATAQRDVPIEIAVKSAGGATIYTNRTAGLAPALVSAPLLPAHGTTTWIDDQIEAAGTPASVSATVGEGEPVTGAIPLLSVQGARLVNDETSGLEEEGSVINHSTVAQRELVLYAVARRAGKVVAAGRALIPQTAAGSSTRFQVFFIGSPQGAQLEFNAPASTFG